MESRSPVLVSNSSTLSAVLRFAAIGAVLTLVVGLLLTMVYGGAEERRAGCWARWGANERGATGGSSQTVRTHLINSRTNSQREGNDVSGDEAASW